MTNYEYELEKLIIYKLLPEYIPALEAKGIRNPLAGIPKVIGDKYLNNHKSIAALLRPPKKSL